MRGFLDDLQRTERPRSPKALSDFRDVLEQVEKHPSERYFILKSIVLNNLYGVDIMEEAVEICKLRLFLKLVAQLETLRPDRAAAGHRLQRPRREHPGGLHLPRRRARRHDVMPNGQHRMLSDEDRRTLDRINEDAEIASAAFNQFRWQQTMLGGEVTSADKQALGDRLRNLADELDRLLAAEYGVDPSKAAAFDAWRDSHQPFHWFVEFYGIMSKGGFDVVIGNPPYVDVTSNVRNTICHPRISNRVMRRICMRWCTERGLNLLCLRGRIGLIVPISMFGTDGFKPLQELSLRICLMPHGFHAT